MSEKRFENFEMGHSQPQSGAECNWWRSGSRLGTVIEQPFHDFVWRWRRPRQRFVATPLVEQRLHRRLLHARYF